MEISLILHMCTSSVRGPIDRNGCFRTYVSTAVGYNLFGSNGCKIRSEEERTSDICKLKVKGKWLQFKRKTHIHTCFHLHFEGKQSLIIG